MCWRRIIRIAVLTVLFTDGAWAQSAGINPISLIIQDESGGNPAAQSTKSTASGLFGDTDSTWAEALADCGCGTTAEYPSAYLAPASLQVAANDALIDQNGLSDWLCSGCDAAFADQVAAAGGPSAFQTSGLDTNPADFASLDTAAGLQAYLAGDTTTTPQQPGITVTADTGGIAASAAAAGATGATAGASFNPFTYLWNQYSAAIAGPLAAELGAVQGMTQAPLTAILSLSVMMMAVGAYSGRFLMADFLNRVIRIAAVVALTGVGSPLYNEYVVQFFGGLPTWFSNNILGATSANPAAGFDVVVHQFAAATSNTWWNLPWGVSSLFLDGPIIAVCFLIVFIAIALMFTVWLIAQALLQLLIVLGPLMVLAILFDHTRGWFDRWLSACMLMIFVTLAADMVTSIVLKVILGAMSTLPFSSDSAQATQDVFNMVGIALVVFVLASAVAILPRVLQHIAAASGAVSMNHAQRWLGGATIAATRGAGRALGAGAKAAVGS